MKEFILDVCSHRGVNPFTATSIEFAKQELGNIFLVKYDTGDAWLDRMRSTAATQFLTHDWAPYIIFLDDDIVFSPWQLAKLLQDLKDGYRLVGGLYPTRTGAQLSSQGIESGGGITLDGTVKEIKWLATGFMGIHKTLLADMVEKLKLPLLHKGQWCECYPFFVFDYDHGMLWSEDWAFPLVAETPVLMSNFNWKQLGNINIGDTVVGFGNPLYNGRPYMYSEVTDKIEHKLESYRVITADGEIMASGKHPFLTSYSTSGAKWCSVERLKAGQLLNIPIKPASNPQINRDYMIGYVKGIWEGDGTIRSRDGLGTLEMTDKEAIDRAYTFVKTLGFGTGEIRQRELPNPNWKPLWGFRCSGGVNNVCNKPITSEDMARGFLAGIYDAEGSFSKGRIRIANKKQSVSDEIGQSLRFIGIHIEPQVRPDGIFEYSLSRQELVHRFWQMTSPAITRKVKLEGHNGNGLIQYAKSPILSIEKTGKKEDLMCLTTTSHNFIANGFASHNCRKANSIGDKTYADTEILVGHCGEKVYWVSDAVRATEERERQQRKEQGILVPELAKEALESVSQIFNEFGIRYWIDSGTLLGAVRDNAINIFDHDIDIRCFKEDIPDEMMSRLVSRLYDVGWRTFQQNYGERRQLLCLSKDNVLLDLKFCESNKDYLWYYVWDESPNSSISPNSEATVHCFPIKFFKKLGHLDFMGNGYPVPEPTIEYLEYHYGQRWKEFKCNPKDVDITDTKWDAQHSPPCAMSQEQLAQLLSPSDKRVLSGTRQISKQK